MKHKATGKPINPPVYVSCLTCHRSHAKLPTPKPSSCSNSSPVSDILLLCRPSLNLVPAPRQLHASSATRLRMISTGTRSRQQQWRILRGAVLATAISSSALFRHYYCSHSHYCPVLFAGTLFTHSSLLSATHFSRGVTPCPAVFGPRMSFDIRFEGPENVQKYRGPLGRTQAGRRRSDSAEMFVFSAHTWMHCAVLKRFFGGFLTPVFPFWAKKVAHAAYTRNFNSLLRKTRFIKETTIIAPAIWTQIEWM